MRICRVIGTVVATVHHHDFDSLKLLLCQPLDSAGKQRGRAVVAADRVQAGVGDKVLVMSEGNGCRQLWGVELEAPLAIRSAVVGIIDEVNITEGGVR
jgi:ethanolamine utilization protein EutN